MRGLREASQSDIRLGLPARVWQCQWIILSVGGWGWWATRRQEMTSKGRSTWTEATKDQVAHACLNLGTDRITELIQFWEMSDLHSGRDLFFNFLWIRVSKQIISCSRKIWPCLLVYLSMRPRASCTLRVQGHSFCSRLWWRSSQTLASSAQYTLPTSPWQDVWPPPSLCGSPSPQPLQQMTGVIWYRTTPPPLRLSWTNSEVCVLYYPKLLSGMKLQLPTGLMGVTHSSLPRLTSPLSCLCLWHKPLLIPQDIVNGRPSLAYKNGNFM